MIKKFLIIIALIFVLTGCSLTMGYVKKGDIEVNFVAINILMKRDIKGFTIKTPDFGDFQINETNSDPTELERLAIEILKKQSGLSVLK